MPVTRILRHRRIVRCRRCTPHDSRIYIVSMSDIAVCRMRVLFSMNHLDVDIGRGGMTVDTMKVLA